MNPCKGLGGHMFFVTFKLKGKQEKHLEIVQSLQSIVRKVKKVEGCIDAQIYRDINNENTFFFVEEWSKQRNLDDHMKSSLYAALLGTNGLLVKSPEIRFLVED
jgi:quinol monooxygenase YgiN